MSGSVLERGNSERWRPSCRKSEKERGEVARELYQRRVSPAKRATETRRGGKKSRRASERDEPWRDSPRYEEAAEAEVEAEAEAAAAAVAAAVPGHQGTGYDGASAAGCSWCRLRDKESERERERGEGARRKFRGGESRGRNAEPGMLEGRRRGEEGGGGWRRHERTPYSEGFQAAVYGPGQRDQDQTSRRRTREARDSEPLVSRGEIRNVSLGGFSGSFRARR